MMQREYFISKIVKVICGIIKLGGLALAKRLKDKEKFIINAILNLVHFTSLLTRFLRTPVSLLSLVIGYSAFPWILKLIFRDLPRTKEQAIMFFQDMG